MKEKVRDNILALILNKLRNGDIYCIFDFEDTTEKEFKNIYGFTKKQILDFCNGVEAE